MRPMIIVVATLLASAIGWLMPAAARAEVRDEPAHAEGHAGGHPHFENAFVLKVAHVELRRLGRTSSAPEEGALENAGGEEEEERGFERHSALGVTYEHVIVEGWLNVELGTLLSSAPGGQLAFPSTLLVKVPAELTEVVEAYLGAGVALELEREQRQWVPIWGAAAAAGLNLWFTEETGFNVDVERSLLFAEELMLELAVGLGVVTRF